MESVNVNLSDNHLNKIRRAFGNNEFAVVRLNNDELNGNKFKINVSPLISKKIKKALEKDVGLTIELDPENQSKMFLNELTAGLEKVSKNIQSLLDGNGIYNPGDRRIRGRGELMKNYNQIKNGDYRKAINSQIDQNIDAAYEGAKGAAIGAAASVGIPPSIAKEGIHEIDKAAKPVINKAKNLSRKTSKEIEKRTKDYYKKFEDIIRKKSLKNIGNTIRDFFGFGINGEELYHYGDGIAFDINGNPYKEKSFVIQDRNGHFRILPYKGKVNFKRKG